MRNHTGILLFVLFSFVFFNSKAQNNCLYNIGDNVFLLSAANFRQLPNTNATIIYSFSVDNKVNFEVVDSNYNNGYIKVKLHVREEEKDTVIKNLSETIGWLLFSLVSGTIDIYSSGNISVKQCDDRINKILEYKMWNSCKYSDFSLAFNYLQRGIAKVITTDNFGAIQDISSAIKINADICLTFAYYYRACAKQALADYTGAVSDYDMTLKQCSVSNYSCACLKCKNNNSFAAPNAFCIEDVYCERAYCKYLLNNSSGALLDLNATIALNPEYGRAYFLRGQIKCDMNNKIGGCADLSKAGELGIEAAYKQIQMRCND
jgi:tetratricopeptide (TPR) repeat protein